MKKLFKIPSIKALVLGQLLLGSLGVSAHADWNWTTLGELKRILGELSPPDPVRELEDIVQWTLAANRITAEIVVIASAAATMGKPATETTEKVDQIRAKVWQIEQSIKGTLSRIWRDPPSAGFFVDDIHKNAQEAQDNFRAALKLHHSVQKAIESRRPDGTGYW
ncbi:MAG: hypothetical protein LBD54_01400 [Puniceicoccales bacterium]|jgi:polyhydroxyalkanoate synthesis regulator phasin|nr:hypothetical protein [Puniceicoccales bacterium]